MRFKVGKVTYSTVFLYCVAISNVKANWWHNIDSPAWLRFSENHNSYNNIAQSGNILQFAPLVIAFGLVVYNRDAQVQRLWSPKGFNVHKDMYDMYKNDGFLQLIATVGSTIGATATLKYAIGRPRPWQYEDGMTRLQHGGRSFPSGHSAIAFSSAFFIAKRYG